MSLILFPVIFISICLFLFVRFFIILPWQLFIVWLKQKWPWKIVWLLTSGSIFLSVILAVIFSIQVLITKTSQASIYHYSQQVPTEQVALILGARVYADGGLSQMTQDRADTAIDLYNSHKVQRILVSGDHGQKRYDEVNTIKKYLLKKGIPPEDLFLDHAGFDTYDSIYRARDIFHVQSMIIISQDFHLPRAVYIAKSLHVNAIGVIADRQDYGNMTGVLLREKIARVKAFIDVLLHDKPEYLGEPIPITGESKKSWD